MTRLYGASCLLLLLSCLRFSEVAAGVTQENVIWQGKPRLLHLFVPSKIVPGKPLPLLLLLHGSGRNGLSLLEKWALLAEAEGLILAAPDAGNTAQWSIASDGPDFLHALAENLVSRYPIDAGRIYLFGHSAGAVYALALGLMESQYFAAVAVHAGALDGFGSQFIPTAKRKIPFAIFVGERDAIFTPDVVRRTRDTLLPQGFPMLLVEIPGHDHWYYDRAPQINRDAWQFLRNYRLAQAPVYQAYRFTN